MMKSEYASIIVVNWNGNDHIITCLSSLANQSTNSFEVIFVDNDSNDGSVKIVHSNYPDVKIIQLDENHGFSAGNNIGIKSSKGEFVALINNDTEADPHWLEESIKALNKFPEAGFTASRICLFNNRFYLDTAGDYYFRTGFPAKRGWLEQYGEDYSEPKWVFGACAAAAVYRRDMLESIGFFDEGFFNYMEDVDLSFRAQLSGYRCIYVPSAIVYHKVSSSVGYRSPQHQFWSHRNHWYTLIKNLPSRLWIRYLWQILISEIIILGSSIQQGRLSVFIRARLDVLRSLPIMLRKRRRIQNQRKVSLDYIDSIIRKDWFRYRRNEKQREKKFRNLLET